MIVLWLLVAHMAGDYLLQSRRMAANKFTDFKVRMEHVQIYTLCFSPIAVIYSTYWKGLAFLLCLWGLHYITDSRRFLSTPMDWIEHFPHRKLEPLHPNPWTPLPIILDQSLHLIQIAILSQLFLQ